MATDEPDEQPAASGTPEEGEPSPSSPYVDLSDLPEPSPQVQLIDDRDLSWVDRPEETEEQRERRRLRREEHKKKVRRKRRARKAVKITGAALAALLVLSFIWFEWTFGGLERMPASAGQAGLDTPGTNILLVGVNPDEPAATAGNGWPNVFRASDMVVVLHLTRDNRSMFVISIPSDSVLPIPGFGDGKLADAFGRGGQNLYLRTVEAWSGIRMDRVAALDMNGLREITNLVGGVVINQPTQVCNDPAGLRRLDGDQALAFMAFVPDCPALTDVGRVQRQQTVLRALMRAAVDGGKLTNPFRVNRVLRATADNLTLEKDFGYPSMLGQLFSMRHLRSSNTTFLTIPLAAVPDYSVNGDPSVRLDPTKDAALWDAVRRDQVASYLATSSDAAVLR
ncbi:MAG: LCP family protein [Marmoricola sp.]